MKKMHQNNFYEMFEKYNQKEENWNKIVEKLQTRKTHSNIFVMATCICLFALLVFGSFSDRILFLPYEERARINLTDLTEKRENSNILDSSFLKKVKLPFSIIDTQSYEEYNQDVFQQNVVIWKGKKEIVTISFATNLELKEETKNSRINGKNVLFYESETALFCECKIGEYQVKIKSENITKKDFIKMIKSMI